MNNVDDIKYRALTTPDRSAVIVNGHSVSYAKFYNGILSVAHLLRTNGVKSGDICGVAITSRPWALTVIFALGHIGAIPVNVPLKVNDLEETKTLGLQFDHLIFYGKAPTSSPIHTITIEPFWIDGAPDLQTSYSFQPDETVYIGLTSATTGRPKAVKLSASALRFRLTSMEFGISSTQWERALCRPGLRSTLGFIFSCLTLRNGKTLVIPGEGPKTNLEIIEQEKCDFIVAAPAQAAELAAYIMQFNLPSITRLKGMLLGGGLLVDALAVAIRKFLTNDAIVMFGSTETGPVSFGPIKVSGYTTGWSGFILPDVKVEIVDESGEIKLNGEVGQLRIASPGSADSFVAADSSSNIAWHYSGDLARIGANNTLIIQGRGDWIINVGGVKIAPEVIEDRLLQIEGVADACVDQYVNRLAINDIQIGIVLKDQSESEKILTDCRTIVKSYVPSYDGKAIVIPAVPRNEMGKIQRGQLGALLDGQLIN